MLFYMAMPICAVLLIVLTSMSHTPTHAKTNPEQKEEAKSDDPCAELFEKLSLEGIINYDIFEKAYKGYCEIAAKKKTILTLIDFTKPSNEERLFVIDMDKAEVLFKTVCAHGQGSGGLMATQFSNKPNSHQSSLGFYLTEETYSGNNGYSLRLKGLEQGFNDMARSRAIVVHGAKYADPAICRKGGRLGRSWGCPAIPTKLARPIIDQIKNGSVLFIYSNIPSYLQHSKILNT